MPQILLTGQFKEKPTYRFVVFIVHSSMVYMYYRTDAGISPMGVEGYTYLLQYIAENNHRGIQEKDRLCTYNFEMVVGLNILVAWLQI